MSHTLDKLASHLNDFLGKKDIIAVKNDSISNTEVIGTYCILGSKHYLLLADNRKLMVSKLYSHNVNDGSKAIGIAHYYDYKPLSCNDYSGSIQSGTLREI